MPLVNVVKGGFPFTRMADKKERAPSPYASAPNLPIHGHVWGKRTPKQVMRTLSLSDELMVLVAWRAGVGRSSHIGTKAFVFGGNAFVRHRVQVAQHEEKK